MSEFNPFSLKDKRILVTGASSGIGQSIAIACSKMGAILYVTGRDQGRLNYTLKELSGSGHKAITADLTTEEGLDFIIREIIELEGVVFSAGVLKMLPVKLIKEKSLNDLMTMNLYAPVLLTQRLVKNNLIKEGGSFVFISSIASVFASLGNSMYMASKGAVNSFSRGVAYELAPKKIRSNCIQPGMVKTNLTKVLSNADLDNEYLKKYPLGRFGEPEDVAYAVIYLLSDTSKWVTGSIITVDGGVTLR